MYCNLPEKKYPSKNMYTGPTIICDFLSKTYKNKEYIFNYCIYYSYINGSVDKESIIFKNSYVYNKNDIPDRVLTYFYLKYCNEKWIEKTKHNISSHSKFWGDDNYIGTLKETVFFTLPTDNKYFISSDIECYSTCGVKSLSTIKILSFDMYLIENDNGRKKIGEKVIDEKILNYHRKIFKKYIQQPGVLDRQITGE